MSLKERRKQPGRHCAECGDARVVTAPGEDLSVATRCPACFSTCSTCEGAGVVFSTSPDEPPTTWPCPECAPFDRRIAMYNQARVPRRFAAATIDGFGEISPSAKSAKASLLRCLAEFSPGDRGIALSGPVGTGKTHLLAGVVRLLTVERGIEARFIEFTHLLSDIKVGFEAGRSEGEIIGRLAAVPVLAIDELGKGLTTDWQMAVLDELVSRRYDRDVTTFFATNFAYESMSTPDTTMSRSRDRFDRSTLEERIGSRMYSRLCGMTDMLRIEGEDYRRRT